MIVTAFDDPLNLFLGFSLESVISLALIIMQMINAVPPITYVIVKKREALLDYNGIV